MQATELLDMHMKFQKVLLLTARSQNNFEINFFFFKGRKKERK